MSVIRPCAGAIAVFVKTSGLSPLKTRLAAGIGQKAAEDFYKLSVAALEEVLAVGTPGNSVYWAVAESEALHHKMWRRFPVLCQGPGGLGQRLHQVYSELIKKHKSVLLIGADSPQISPEIFEQAFDALQRPLEGTQFTLGPAEDGGFYLFGGNQEIPKEVWLQVSYSQADTADQLVKALGPYGVVHELRSLLDIDTADDLRRFHHLYHTGQTLLPQQWQVVRWISLQLQGQCREQIQGKNCPPSVAEQV